jgi:hypothetical protein
MDDRLTRMLVDVHGIKLHLSNLERQCATVSTHIDRVDACLDRD